MLFTELYNAILSFFDVLIPNNYFNINFSDNPFFDVMGYGLFVFGNAPLHFIEVALTFFSLKILIGVVQWVWDRLPLT